ncbi:hypothetical protein [Streptomyces sp. VRA16 Mangrove soil]|uniref:hypothetical protein n=1 Tax=Streptomyces sp. VRA16 Mangrove soil TaxID=2817434 RepID=UPI001A9F8066|nr:hypothetical protein [Streptomyces sp. VRA16 Mangrove soil]MBO1330810.1 hypothetical protein [Streptomyces sp. VRA16 Mangrove soil]
MPRTRSIVTTGALTLAALLTGAGWLGYQQWAAAPVARESITTYDPDDPHEVSRTADEVFTATVVSPASQQQINGLARDVYPVHVKAVHKGAVHGDLTVAVESGHTHLKTGRAYVFATFPFDEPHDTHGQVTETTPQPATEETMQTWHRATHQR